MSETNGNASAAAEAIQSEISEIGVIGANKQTASASLSSTPASSVTSIPVSKLKPPSMKINRPCLNSAPKPALPSKGEFFH